MNLKERTKAIKINIPALYIAMKRKDTPTIAKILAVLTVGYALSPIDLIPDFIPVIGYLDDLIILPLLVTLTIKNIPEEIFEECKIEAENIWQNGKPKKWYLAIPFIIIWLIILKWIISFLIH